MPVHRQKKDSTTKTNSPGSMQEQTALSLPDQQTFQQYLRELARGAIRVVLEAVMREELDTLIGVGWGECSPKRKGYRNGFYSRDLVTCAGYVGHPFRKIGDVCQDYQLLLLHCCHKEMRLQKIESKPVLNEHYPNNQAER